MSADTYNKARDISEGTEIMVFPYAGDPYKAKVIGARRGNPSFEGDDPDRNLVVKPEGRKRRGIGGGTNVIVLNSSPRR